MRESTSVRPYGPAVKRQSTFSLSDLSSLARLEEEEEEKACGELKL